MSCASATACNAVGKFTDSSGTTSSLGETWDGAAWTIQPTPNPSGSQSGHLAGVACTSPTACIAAGGNRDGAGVAVTLAEAWDGTAWTVQSTPNPNGGDAWSDLPGVSCTSASACTAVGSYSSVNAPERILAEGWNGAAWTIQAPPNPSGSPSTSLSAVSCAGATTCIAVGDYHDPATATLMTLAERWDGTAWTIQPTPNPAGSGASSLVGVSCASATSCVAVGSSRVGAFGDTVPLAEHWDGAAWTIQPTPMPGGASRVVLSGVSCTSAAACTAVGQSGGQWALVERWDGTAWTIQPTPNPIGGTYSGLSGVSCPGATACTAVGTYAAGGSPSTLAESWDGTAWAVQPTPVPAGSHDSALSGVSCPTAGLCAAVGRSRDSLGTTASLAERWDGTAWTIQPTPNPSGSRTNELSGVSCTAPTACAASGDARDSAGTPVTLTERYGR